MIIQTDVESPREGDTGAYIALHATRAPVQGAWGKKRKKIRRPGGKVHYIIACCAALSWKSCYD